MNSHAGTELRASRFGTEDAWPAGMNEWSVLMRERTRRFALEVIRFVRTMPLDVVTEVSRRQLVRAATGVAFNYRSASRARSHTEFTARLGIVLEEADEAEGWLDLICDAGLSPAPELRRLRQESKELRAIFAKAKQTASQKERETKEERKKGRKVER